MRKRTYQIKFRGGYFIDDVRESRVDEYQLKVRRRILLVAAFVAAICLAWYFISSS